MQTLLPPLVELRPHQRLACNFMLEHPACGLFLEVGVGKAVDDDTIVPTPDGNRRLGDLEVGDRLFDEKGAVTTISAVYHHTSKDAYEVTLRDGRSFICCDEHLVPYQTYTGAKKVKAAPLGALMRDYKREVPGRTVYKYRIPQPDACQMPASHHVIHPYMLGVLLGDGCLSGNCSLTVSSADEDVVMRAADLQGIPHGNVRRSKSNYNWSYTCHPMADAVRRELRRIGLWGASAKCKRIPEDYLYDSVENRFQLLCGLLDTDGTLSVSHRGDTDAGNAKHGIAFLFSSASRELASQVAWIARSLGYCATESTYSRPGKPDEHRVSILTHDTPMTCARKLSADTGVRATIFDRQMPIHDIRYIGKRDMTCFTVDSPSHLFLINDFIVTHNTLTVLEGLYELNPQGHVLVIGPKPVMKATWADEIAKFGFPFRTNSLIVDERGRQRKRDDRHALYRDLASMPPSIWFLNREMVCDLIENLPRRGKAVEWPFPVVVIDEAQSFKSYSAKRFKALAAMRPAISRIVELSGTPTPNGMEDLWPLMYLLDGGERLGDCITRYRERYFYPDPYIRTPQGYPAKWHLQEGADKLIYDAVGDLVISMRNIASTMPTVTYNDIHLEMGKDEWALYKELMKESVLEFEEGHQVVAANSAVLQAKLLQLASGALYLDGTNTTWQEVHHLKLDAVMDIVSNAGSPVLVAYWFKSDRKMLEDRFAAEGVQFAAFDGSPQMVHDWNARKIPVMLVQPASAGHGLNLQQGGHTLVWYTLTFNLEHYIQTNARIYRQGQPDPVIIHRLIVNRTVDEKVALALEQKTDAQDAFTDAVRYALGAVR